MTECRYPFGDLIMDCLLPADQPLGIPQMMAATRYIGLHRGSKVS
jgi:hypothetical protein